MTATPAAPGPRPTPVEQGLVHTGLARASMGPVEVLAQSISAIAPSAVMATGPALVVLSAGNGTWLSYAMAMVLVLPVREGEWAPAPHEGL